LRSDRASVEIDRLRTEVEALRAERIATDVTKEVHEGLLKAARDGVGIEGFDFEVETEDAIAEEQW